MMEIAQKTKKVIAMKSKIGGNLFSRCKAGRRSDLDNHFFRSSWEANYCRILCLLKKQGEILFWEYEPQTFVFPGITHGAVSYLPDFRITYSDNRIEFHEVKGWMTKASKTKIKRMAKFYPEVVLKIIDTKLYHDLEKEFGVIIPTWEWPNKP